MAIEEFEIDDPEYRNDIEFVYGYDEQLLEKKNADYWVRKRLEYYKTKFFYTIVLRLPSDLKYTTL